MAEWWFLYSCEAAVQKPCVELWFCDCSNRRRSFSTNTDSDWWIYEECRVLKAARRLRAQDVLEQLCYLFIYRWLPGFIHSDNGAEFTAKAVRHWLGDWAFKLYSLNQEVLGKMDTMNHSMES